MSFEFLLPIRTSPQGFSRKLNPGREAAPRVISLNKSAGFTQGSGHLASLHVAL